MTLKPRQPVPAPHPQFSEVLQSLDFVLDRNYPARGEA